MVIFKSCNFKDFFSEPLGIKQPRSFLLNKPHEISIWQLRFFTIYSVKEYVFQKIFDRSFKFIFLASIFVGNIAVFLSIIENSNGGHEDHHHEDPSKILIIGCHMSMLGNATILNAVIEALYLIFGLAPAVQNAISQQMANINLVRLKL